MTKNQTTRMKKAPKESSAKPTDSYHHGDLRASLIQAALDILDRDSADALSLRVIAQEVGVSHTAPYSHFKNKQELIAAVKSAGVEKLADALSEAVAVSDKGSEVMLAYGTAYLKFAIDHPELYRLMLGQVESRGLRDKKQILKKRAKNNNQIYANRAFGLMCQACEEFYETREIAYNKALGAWALVHGLSAMFIEGLLPIPASKDLESFFLSVAPSLE